MVALSLAGPVTPAHASTPVAASVANRVGDAHLETTTDTAHVHTPAAEPSTSTLASDASASRGSPEAVSGLAPSDDDIESPCTVDTECPGAEVCTGGVCAAPSTPAGCVNDTQCKGDRICERGTCRTPVPPPAPMTAATSAGPAVAPMTAPAPTGAAPTPLPPAPNWARGGATTGIVLGSLGVALGLAAEFTADDGGRIPALPLGGAATLAFAMSTPIAAAAGRSARVNLARRGVALPGSRGIRVTGWVLYGLCLTNAVGLISLGIMDIQPFPGQISTTSIFGGAAAMLMAGDALRTDRALRSGVWVSPTTASHGTSPRGPLVRFHMGPSRDGGAQVGLSGRF